MGVNIGMFIACNIHCVYSGVGRRNNSSCVLMRWILHVVLNKNKVHVIVA